VIVIYCGVLGEGETSRMRFEALRRCGHCVEGVDTSTGLPRTKILVSRVARKAGWVPDWSSANSRLLARSIALKPDIIWIDKGLSIRPSTLRRIKALDSKVQLIHYSPDDMSGTHNRSRQYRSSVPVYDLHVTTKSFNVGELRAEGARDVLFLNNAYCPETHRPVPLSKEEKKDFGCQVGFVGTFEEERANAIWFLVNNGIPVRIWGDGWQHWARHHRHPLLLVETASMRGAEYTKVVCALDINLGFLRKLNRDLQTTRSVEVPACGSFLLAERTAEHNRMFREGIEADFFETWDEMLGKCKYYISHADERMAIAAAGRRRCTDSGYSYDGQVTAVLDRLEKRH
jgi:spore maturation protein CgeB